MEETVPMAGPCRPMICWGLNENRRRFADGFLRNRTEAGLLFHGRSDVSAGQAARQSIGRPS